MLSMATLVAFISTGGGQQNLIFGCRLIDGDECLMCRTTYETANMSRIFLYKNKSINCFLLVLSF